MSGDGRSSEVGPLIELVDIHAGYGTIEVLRKVNVSVFQGELLAILGPNGGGKTTLLKVLCGQLQPTRGHVHIGGQHINGAPTAALARMGVCLIPEGRGIFPNLSVRENLRVFSHAGVALNELEERTYARLPRLGERRHQLAGSMSGGEQQMLALSRGLETDPAILIVDELSMGLAPRIVAELLDSVAAVVADGVTVILVEQFAKLVLPVADRVVLMAGGQVRFDGDPSDALSVLDGAYLGEQHA